MTRRVLLIAYHFPPVAGSSGVQRTLRFARHLPEFGWDPIVLTVHPRAYERTAADQLSEVPEGLEVVRAPAWDTARHFSLAGKYPAFLARPDRWISWWPMAVAQGMGLVRRTQPTALWSTYPIATAHRIGVSLSTRTGLPWVADFRDPMAQDGYPRDRKTWLQFARLERLAVARAERSVFTTPGAAEMYRTRYPERAERITMIENGYDEESFPKDVPDESPLNPGRITLLHSGVVYSEERDPTQMFAAIARLKNDRPDLYRRIVVRFRAPVHEGFLQELTGHYGVDEAIQIVPALGYTAALREMVQADGLLVLQASNCNQQVPAKLYEYLRAGRPMLAFTDPDGDTANVIQASGIDSIAPLDDAAAIGRIMAQFLKDPGAMPLPEPAFVEAASRRSRTGELARILDTMVLGNG